jgi:hypothetical protein
VIRAYLNIASDDLDPDRITEVLGRSPDRIWRRRSPIRPAPDVHDRHLWALDLAAPGIDHFGMQELSAAITGLGDDLAVRCWELCRRSATITLQVVQEVNGEEDHESQGIHLTYEAIVWLAAAGAQIDIDQYFFSV